MRLVLAGMGNRAGSNRFAAAPTYPARTVARVDQFEGGQQLAPGAKPLVHRIGITRPVLPQPSMQAANTVATMIQRRGRPHPCGTESGHGPRHKAGRSTAATRTADLRRPPVAGHRSGEPDALDRRRAAPQQFMQRAQDLSRERRQRHRPERRGWRSGSPANAYSARREQTEAVEQQLEPAEHRSAGNRPHRAERKCNLTRCFATRRMHQTPAVVGSAATRSAHRFRATGAPIAGGVSLPNRARLLADPGQRRPAGVAQASASRRPASPQPNRATVRFRLPARMPAAISWQRRRSGRSGDMAGRPIQDRAGELPRIADGGTGFRQQSAEFFGVGAGLFGRHKALISQYVRRHNKPHGLDVAEPFDIWIVCHGQFVIGQRYRSPTISSRAARTR